MSLSESQTRKGIIDQRLLKAGWNVNDPSRVIEELDIITDPQKAQDPGEKYAGHLFSDYALLGKDAYPLAVVEAKKTSRNAEEGKWQAASYAESIQKNNPGMDLPFIIYTNGHEIFFWDSLVYPPRKVYGFPSRDDLERLRFIRNHNTSLSEELINPEISGRPYQIAAIRSVLEDIEKKRRKFLLVMATGTGKTRTCAALIDVLMRTNHVQRVLFLVDRIALRDQALDAFTEHLPNAPLWPKKEGNSVESDFTTDRRIYVTTYPTILNEIEDDNCKFSPHFFDLVVADESHRSIYNVYKNIFDYFDAIQLGLTATPTEQLDHNTFKLFDCEDQLPTYNFSYEEAVKNTPPYLSDFEVLKIRTRFMDEGISARTITSEDAKRLLSEGKDPDEINYEGSDLEKRVTNKGTNALIVREFMEECIKSPDGVLPGKTIIFAVSKKHAFRIVETFDRLYPEYKGRIADVLISGIKGVYGKGGLLDRFRNSDMPRVAVSVDMLDTGIDILEIVNLVFAKPVYSYTKFWQMIGRGTRVLDNSKLKPWCLEKDKFLIIDMWENFEYFKQVPKGRESKSLKPLPVRLFEARLDELSAAREAGNQELQNIVTGHLRSDIKELPANSVIVLDARADLELVEGDEYWSSLNDQKIDDLRRLIAPVMRAKSQSDFKAIRFEINVVDLATAHVSRRAEKYDALRDAVIEQIKELPLTINIVRREKDYIETVCHRSWWQKFIYPDLDILVNRLGPLMKFKDDDIQSFEVKLDLLDEVTEKKFIEFGPEHERISVLKYRERVEATIKALLDSNFVLQKLRLGADLTEDEIQQLGKLLRERDPWVTEDLLRKVYDNRHARFIQFIRYILGLEKLKSFTEEVTEAFSSFIAEHNTYTQQQVEFLLTLQTFILRKGSLEKKDLVKEPFTKISPDGILGLFRQSEIEEILKFTEQLVA
ncbi:MAG TPA: DEAD/DEAH box helicase family protein [Bacteroidales bacterium]|nr:DEAD/DEAH box helicase family protein [Bacteroidales bacterium]